MRRKSILVSLAALAVVAVLATSLVNAGNSPQGEVQPEAAPSPSAPGFYLVGSKSLESADFNHAGEMQFWAWSELHAGPNAFNWERMDEFIARHYVPANPAQGQPGKKAAIALTTYDGRSGLGAKQMPAWVRATPNTTIPGVFDAFDLGDTREKAVLDPVPTFMNIRLDRNQLRGADVRSRRAFGPTVFKSTWSYVDHVLVAPGASTVRSASSPGPPVGSGGSDGGRNGTGPG